MQAVRPIVVLAALVWLVSATAWAQSSPVMQHYRAYQAALEADDLATAEGEAAAALAASEARDGDGGPTAILALNLAAVRLLNDNAGAALDPGRRALALAQSRGEELSGVSPALAQLIVARAELAAGQRGADDRLAQALGAAVEARLAPAEVYDAARQLAIWSLEADRYEQAAQAWSIAADFAEGSRLSSQHARAIALTGRGAALFMNEVFGPRQRIDQRNAREALAALHEALQLLRPLALINADGGVTAAQASYAEALAWRAVMHAKLSADGAHIPEMDSPQGDEADGLSEIGVAPAAWDHPRCQVRIVPRSPQQLYPSGALRRGLLAGVAVRFRINDAGQLIEADALATVGGEDFGEAVQDPGAWRVERDEASPPNCRMGMAVIRSIAFSIR